MYLGHIFINHNTHPITVLNNQICPIKSQGTCNRILKKKKKHQKCYQKHQVCPHGLHHPLVKFSSHNCGAPRVLHSSPN